MFDAGGFLPEGETAVRDTPGAAARYVRTLLAALRRTGVTAAACDHGMRAFLQAHAVAETDALGPALLDADPPAPALLLSWGGRNIAVLALEESSPDSVIARAAGEARGRADFLIVLARADALSGRRLARLARADVVILSRGARPPRPLEVDGALLVGCGASGREVGELRLVASPAAGGSGALRPVGFELHAMAKGVPEDSLAAAWAASLMDVALAPLTE